MSQQAIRTWADPEVATEHGAYGIAALLIEVLTDLARASRMAPAAALVDPDSPGGRNL